GSKRAGVLQTVLGVALIVAGFFAKSPNLMIAGAGMALGGAAQMLSPQAKGLSQSAAPENLPSYAFGSARNTTASGNPVPICYGSKRAGVLQTVLGVALIVAGFFAKSPNLMIAGA
ncbi:hypothetical protein ACXKGW_29765, partial [Klebsiella pneumoniae subsp. pneumoniae]